MTRIQKFTVGPIVATALILAACATPDKVIIAMDGIIAAATVDEIVQSNNPKIVALDNVVIDDAGQTITLWTTQPHTSAIISQLVNLWQNVVASVDPSIAPTVSAIVRAITTFISQLQTVTPAPTPTGLTAHAPRLSSVDNAKVVEMRGKLAAAKAKLQANPAGKNK